jgi:hypothetical protein
VPETRFKCFTNFAVKFVNFAFGITVLFAHCSTLHLVTFRRVSATNTLEVFHRFTNVFTGWL